MLRRSYLSTQIATFLKFAQSTRDPRLAASLLDKAVALNDEIEGIRNDISPSLAKSGEEAITLLKSRAVEYRALITDINLIGRFSGWDVARAAREIDRHLPVIYMTGAAGEEWPVHGVPNSILLCKPFAPAQAVAAVSQLLNVQGPSGTGSG